MATAAGPADEQSGPGRRWGPRSRWLRGLLGVLGTAVAGAVAAAVITPDTLHALTSRVDPALDFARVASGDGTLAVEVPATWAAGDSTYEDDAGEPLGPGLTAGVDPALPVATVTPRAFLGASASQARQLLAADDRAGLDPALTDLVRARDWTLDECVFDREVAYRRDDGVHGVYRVWRGCMQTDLVLYDGLFAPADGSYVAALQVQVPAEDADETAQHLLETFRVLPERL